MAEYPSPVNTEMELAMEMNNKKEILGIVLSMTSLALCVLSLRLLTRFLIIKKPALEDAFITAAMVFSIGTTVATCFGVKFGLGTSFKTMQPFPDQVIGFFKSTYASVITYSLGLVFTTLSILLQYLRISVHKFARRATLGTMVFVALYGIEFFFAAVFTCTPVAFFWDKSINGGFCVDKWALYFANAGMNIFTDLVILVLPIFILRDLQRPKLQKLMLMGIIALGGFACIASIIRLHALRLLANSSNPTWDGQASATWSVIELNVAIICASLSTLRPLFARILPSVFDSQEFLPELNHRRAAKSAWSLASSGSHERNAIWRFQYMDLEFRHKRKNSTKDEENDEEHKERTEKRRSNPTTPIESSINDWSKGQHVRNTSVDKDLPPLPPSPISPRTLSHPETLQIPNSSPDVPSPPSSPSLGIPQGHPSPLSPVSPMTPGTPASSASSMNTVVVCLEDGGGVCRISVTSR